MNKKFFSLITLAFFLFYTGWGMQHKKRKISPEQQEEFVDFLKADGNVGFFRTQILEFLPIPDLLQARLVCKFFKERSEKSITSLTIANWTCETTPKYQFILLFCNLKKLYLLKVDISKESLKKIISNKPFQNNMTDFALILDPKGNNSPHHTPDLFKPILDYKKLKKLYIGDWTVSDDFFRKFTEQFKKTLKTLFIWQTNRIMPKNKRIKNFGEIDKFEKLQELYLLNVIMKENEWKKIIDSPSLQKNLKAIYLYFDDITDPFDIVIPMSDELDDDIAQFKNLTVYFNAHGPGSLSSFLNTTHFQDNLRAVTLVEFCSATLDLLLENFLNLKAVFVLADNEGRYSSCGITSDDTSDINELKNHDIKIYYVSFIIPYSFIKESHKYH